MALSTSLILEVCRTRVTYELHNGRRSPESLCGSVVQHRSAEFEGLRFHSSWGLRIFSLSLARDKTQNILLYYFEYFEDYHYYVNHRDVIRPVISMVDLAFLTKTNRYFNIRARLLGLEKDVKMVRYLF